MDAGMPAPVRGIRRDVGVAVDPPVPIVSQSKFRMRAHAKKIHHTGIEAQEQHPVLAQMYIPNALQRTGQEMRLVLRGRRPCRSYRIDKFLEESYVPS